MSDLRDIAVKYAHLLSAPDYSKLLLMPTQLATTSKELRNLGQDRANG